VRSGIFRIFVADFVLEHEPEERRQVGDRRPTQGVAFAKEIEYSVAEYIVPESADAR